MGDIEQYLNQELTYKEKDGYDKYGKIDSIESTFMGRLEFMSSTTTGIQAKPLDFDVIVFMLPDQQMAVDDIIADENNDYRVVRVMEYRDREGELHHKEAECIKYV